jgi:hypothetical protein
VPFDITKFLFCRAIAERANPDTGSADRVAMLTSMMNWGLVQSAVVASALASNEAPIPMTAVGGNTRLSRRGATRSTAVARVKVPSVKHLSAEKEIHEYLGQHRLRARIHAEPSHEVKEARVIFQSPEPDEETAPEGEVIVVLLTPREHRAAGHEEHGGPKRR